jgi:hypothetical protein
MCDVDYGSALRAPAHGPGGPAIARCRLRGMVGPGSVTEESMDADDGRQKGAQEHAEGQHGEKTHSRLLEQIHEPMHRDEEQAEDDGTRESGGDDRQRR